MGRTAGDGLVGSPVFCGGSAQTFKENFEVDGLKELKLKILIPNENSCVTSLDC